MEPKLVDDVANDRFKPTPVSDLKLGMYVSDLDRDWLGTPFLLQSFLIISQSQISQLKELCAFVYIDIAKSVMDYGVKPKPITTKNQQSKNDSALEKKPKSLAISLKKTFPDINLKEYKSTTSFDNELSTAKKVFEQFQADVGEVFEKVRDGEKIAYKKIREVVKGTVKSLIRNPKACELLQQIKCKGGMVYDHAVGVSIWSAAVGRQIGLPEEDLIKLATIGLLADSGKAMIPDEILYKKEALSEEEIAFIQKHVDIDSVYETHFSGLPKSIVESIGAHHERHDGSGYPKGLEGENIPVFARIVGIADSYTAMTSFRPYAKPKSSYLAARELYKNRDILFQAELVEEFIQAVGLYPAGTLVEISNGEVGFVVETFKGKRLRPRLLILLDSEKKPLDTVRYLNLLDIKNEALNIVSCLEPDAYGIEKDVFI